MAPACLAPAGLVMLVAWGEHAELTRGRRTGAGDEGGAAFLSGLLLRVGSWQSGAEGSGVAPGFPSPATMFEI